MSQGLYTYNVMQQMVYTPSAAVVPSAKTIRDQLRHRFTTYTGWPKNVTSNNNVPLKSGLGIIQGH